METTPCAVVTGAGRGIGAAVAKELSCVMPVITVGKTTNVEAVASEIRGWGCNAKAVVVDVRSADAADETLVAAGREGWHPDALVCCAGIAKSGATHEFDMNLWRDMFATNVTAAFTFAKMVLPGMLSRGRGTIVLMSSVAGVKGYAYNAAYCATKAALVGFARSLAKEYGKHGIVVVPVCPGFVDTDMTTRTIKSAMARSGITESEARRRVERANPQRRIIPAEEVAEAVADICSGRYRSVAGEPFMMTGGE